MKKWLTIAGFLLVSVYTTAFLLFVSPDSNKGEIVLEGNYWGKNLLVQNPTDESQVGFCTYEVKVNGLVSFDELNSGILEIDFSAMGLKFGTQVVVSQTQASVQTKSPEPGSIDTTDWQRNTPPDATDAIPGSPLTVEAEHY